METPEPRGKLDAAMANGPEGDVLDWDAVDWRRVEDDVRRLRQRIFTARQAGNLQHYCIPDLDAFRACLSPVRPNGARRVLKGRRRSNAPPLPDWKPVYYLLEDDLECWLLNAHHLRNVPGRKTDVKDAEWICQLVEHGLVRPSFVPPRPIRQLRDLTRYRKVVIQERTREAQRLEKVLEDAGIKLSSVATDILGVSGRAMLAALIGGSCD